MVGYAIRAKIWYDIWNICSLVLGSVAASRSETVSNKLKIYSRLFKLIFLGCFAERPYFEKKLDL